MGLGPSKKELSREDVDSYEYAIRSGNLSVETMPKDYWNNYRLTMEALKTSGLNLQYAPSSIQNKICHVLTAVGNTPESIKFAFQPHEKHLRQLEEVISKHPEAFAHLDDGLRSNKQFIFKMLNTKNVNGRDIITRHMSLELRSDRAFLLQLIENTKAMTQYYSCIDLEYVSESLRNDETIVMHCVSRNREQINHASESLQSNPEFVGKLIMQNPRVLLSTRDDVARLVDINCLKQAIRKNSVYVFRYMPPFVQDHPELVELLLDKDISQFKHISDRFRADRVLATKVVRKNMAMLRHVHRSLLTDPTWLRCALGDSDENLRNAYLEIFTKDPEAFYHLMDTDPEPLKVIYKVLMQEDQSVLSTLVQRYPTNRPLLLQAIDCDPSVYQYASVPLRANLEIALTVISQSIEMLAYVDELLVESRVFLLKILERDLVIPDSYFDRFSDDAELMQMYIQKSPVHLNRVSNRLRDDRGFILAVVRDNGMAFLHLPIKWKSDAEICHLAIKTYGFVFTKLPHDQRGDRELLLEAVSTYPSAIHSAVGELRNDRECIRLAIEAHIAKHGDTKESDWFWNEYVKETRIGKQVERWQLEDPINRKSFNMLCLHAQFISYPIMDESPPNGFPDLGWYYCETLCTF
eukprot:scaffold3487_cov251-Pinguiococcus_pyrenoidosus.AAC.1